MCVLTKEQLATLKTDEGKFEAPLGFRWICLKCGKTAFNRIGPSVEGSPKGWDASCAINCVLAHEKDIQYAKGGLVEEILLVAYNPGG